MQLNLAMYVKFFFILFYLLNKINTVMKTVGTVCHYTKIKANPETEYEHVNLI